MPYLGTFLTDLMMIDTAYPDKIDVSVGIWILWMLVCVIRYGAYKCWLLDIVDFFSVDY